MVAVCYLLSSIASKNPKSKMAFEVVIMIGFPGSGKSTYVKTHFNCPQYHIVDGDRFKTPHTMIRDATAHVEKQSIVFDSTGYSADKRAAFVQFGQSVGLPIRAVWITTSLEDSKAQNELRKAAGGNYVPSIAYAYYKKHFEVPDESEGFVLEMV